MTASVHFKTFTVGLQRYTVLGGSLMKDETVIPYVQGDIRIPVTAENYESIKALDPRLGPRGVLTLVQRFGESDPVSVLSEQYASPNLFANGLPSSASGWTASGGETVTFISEEEGVQLADPVGGGGGYLIPTIFATPGVGRWAAVGVDIKPLFTYVAANWRTYARVSLSGTGDQAVVTGAIPFNEWSRQVVSVQQTDPAATSTRAILWPSNTPSPGPQFRARRLVIAFADTQAEAEAAVAEYQQRTGTIADLTAAWDGWVVKNVSDTYGRPYNDFGMKPSTRLTANLGIREVLIDYDTWEATVRLASDEARLMDTINIDTTERMPDDSTVRESVQMVLASIGSFLQVDEGADADFRSDAGGWAPGQSAWSYVQPLVETAGLRLYCDETGRWHLVEQETDPEKVTRLQSAQVSSMNTRTDREGDWADAVLIEYRWRDVSDVEHVVYDYAATSQNPTRPRFYRHDRVWPGNGAAASILSRAVLAGQRTQATAVSDYSVSTDGTLAVSFTSLGEVLAGDIESVQWFLDDDRMTVIAKDSSSGYLPTSWLLAPSDFPWQDVPAGIDWTEAGVLVETEA